MSASEKLKLVECWSEFSNGLFGQRAQLDFSRSCLAGLGHHAPEVFVHHVDDAADQIAVAVGEVAVVALNQRVEGEIAVLAERNFAEEEVAERIGAEDFLNSLGARTMLPRDLDILP